MNCTNKNIYLHVTNLITNSIEYQPTCVALCQAHKNYTSNMHSCKEIQLKFLSSCPSLTKNRFRPYHWAFCGCLSFEWAMSRVIYYCSFSKSVQGLGFKTKMDKSKSVKACQSYKSFRYSILFFLLPLFHFLEKISWLERAILHISWSTVISVALCLIFPH